jgi:hypothetical protein
MWTWDSEEMVMTSRKRPPARRGVLMLLVLGILAMFGMVAIAYVIITAQFREIAETHRKIGQYAEQPEEQLDQVAMAVFRGDDNAADVIGGQSLLDDLYGNDSVVGNVEIYKPQSGESVTDAKVLATKPNYVTQGQIFEITVRLLEPADPTRQLPIHRFPGRVLTFTSGTCSGISTRIVGARQATDSGGAPMVWPSTDTVTGQPDPLAGQPIWRLQHVAEEWLPTGPDARPGKGGFDDDGNSIPDDAIELAYPNPALAGLAMQLRGDTDDVRYGDRFVINGVPFCGTGFGFNPATGRLDEMRSGWDLALLPYHSDNRNPAGGANEDYDAVDYQNMALALVLPDGRVPIPSFVRPELARYWFRRINGRAVNPADPNDFYNNLAPDLQRWICGRPLWTHHPGFTGSNPAVTPANPGGFNPVWDGVTTPWDGVTGFAWDVDNDGDGHYDSVWVDVGMPARTLPDGRMYKPLAAILAVDLDGRLNLNAHGALAQRFPGYYSPVVPSGNQVFAGEPGTPPLLPRGQGYGPAEINLLPLFSHMAAASRLGYYDSLLLGVYLAAANQTIDGRYGESWRMRDPANHGLPAPGLARVAPNNYAPQIDPLFFNKFCDYPQCFPTDWAVCSYGALPDLKGSLAMGVDLRGQPIYHLVDEPLVVPTGGNPYLYALSNTPYELNLGRASPRGSHVAVPTDHPFSVYELERLFRRNDRDAQALPRRLGLLSTAGSSLDLVLAPRRHELTTEQWDLPCPAAVFTPSLRQESVNKSLGARPQHVADLLRAKLPAGLPPDQVARLTRQLLPLDFLAGLRMDLNRPLGNGRDDNNNGVVDEWEEAFLGETIVDAQGSNAPCNHTNGIDVNNDGVVNQIDRRLARQLYARHLYVLMMLLADWDETGAAHPAWTDRDARARWIAQWAVNVVDFRDRDSVMTVFEYDPDPFTSQGWRVDGDPATDNLGGTSTVPPVVWGTERPELLITETLALHARRTEDLASPNGQVGDPETDATNDFDQRLYPLASLFVEIFNPWPATLGDAGEFCYDRSASSWRNGVLLNQRTPQGHPVWRLTITPGENENDPDDPNAGTQPPIERSVYFADPTGLPANADDAAAVRYHNTRPIAPLLHNRYAVIGPGDANGRTLISAPTDPTDTKIRQIVLAPNPDPDAPNQVQMLFNENANAGNQLPVARMKNPIAVLIDEQRDTSTGTGTVRRMSVSEPAGGYTGLDPTTFEYNPIRDAPVDTDAPLTQTGLTPRYKIVHLQRLANPLEPYDPVQNPYRTIDTAPIDLFTYNGWDPAGDSPTEPGATPYLQDPPVFHSRERGVSEPLGRNNVWRPEAYNRPAAADAAPLHTSDQRETAPLSHCFNRVLQHTLGYLNRPYYVSGSPDPNPRDGTLPEYVGDVPAGPPGSPPFPMIPWNNRPYVSPLELLLVPTHRSSRLLWSISSQMLETNTPYAPGPPGQPGWENGHFPFLANYYHSVMDGGAARAAQLHRVLEFVRVPSPFVGTEIQLNPATAIAGTHGFYPPFHRISTYREPGRINLNTIFSPDVWAGLMNDLDSNFAPALFGRADFFNQRFLVSRRGYGSAVGNWDQTLLAMDDHYPSRFANPFRSFAGGQLVPGTPPPPLDPTNGREINATLLREDPVNSQRPLFAFDRTIAPTQAMPWNDPDRNPFFRYQSLQRLGNLVTTRSNVYAVWITIGYFEVTPVSVDAAHPDGFQLGQELGYDSGEVRRHRGFYIFDRSVPVGFERGKNHNVHKAILLRRYLE